MDQLRFVVQLWLQTFGWQLVHGLFREGRGHKVCILTLTLSFATPTLLGLLSGFHTGEWETGTIVRRLNLTFFWGGAGVPPILRTSLMPTPKLYETLSRFKNVVGKLSVTSSSTTAPFPLHGGLFNAHHHTFLNVDPYLTPATPSSVWISI